MSEVTDEQVAECRRKIEAKVGYALTDEEVEKIREALERQAEEAE